MRPDNLHRLRHAILTVVVPLAGCTSIDKPTDPDPSGTPQAPQPPEASHPPAKQVEPPTPREKIACAGDREIIGVDNQPTGYSICGDGSVHRSRAVACEIPAVLENACPGGDSEGPCQTDADCGEKPHGRCIAYPRGPWARADTKTYCGCHYACIGDNDCAADEVCVCTGALAFRDGRKDTKLPRCEPAECRTDSDCSSGECGAAIHFNGCSEAVTIACREGGDACRTHGACEEGRSCMGMTVDRGSLTETTKWECTGMTCVIGRPFLVAGNARVAKTIATKSASTWISDMDFTQVPADREMAEHWRHVGQLEHASVASFARFINQLLALGAPPDLLVQARAALADEIRHTQLCLQMSQRFGGCAVPGFFDLRGSQSGPVDRVRVAQQLFEEACLGETIGVAQALEAAALASDADTRDVYTLIADDELRHAQLAWRTLRWLIESAHPDQRRAIEHSLTDSIDRAGQRLLHAEACTPQRPVFGLPGLRSELCTSLTTLHEVVKPGVEALVTRASRPA